MPDDEVERTTIDGRTLTGWGFEPGPLFKALLARAAELAAEGRDEAEIRDALAAVVPAAPAVLRLRDRGEWAEAIAADTEAERDNLAGVRAHMAELARNPMVERAAVMPDACPAGNQPGTIPVGGAVASRGIHPAFHSADICCSMHVTLYEPGVATGEFMDALAKATHFGPGGRGPSGAVRDPITDELDRTDNPFLKDLGRRALGHLATQGDGNHFAYLGELRATPPALSRLMLNGRREIAAAMAGRLYGQGRGEAGLLALVTHHGSRDLGAQVYKRGQEAAVRHTARVSPETPKHQAWLDPESEGGAAYWRALEYVARWTKRNHELVHERAAARLGLTPLAAFGNEHNFVWRRDDGLHYHGKGATPAWRDGEGRPLLGVIPLNMAEPILLTLGRANEKFLGFSPHGAGRNESRTSLLRKLGLAGLPADAYLARSRELLAEQTAGLDVRFFFDRPDVSETPVAYKDAAAVREQIDRFGLADVVAEITPLGCLMAGDHDKPRLVKRAKRSDDQTDAVEP